jgi:hypothetical protein
MPENDNLGFKSPLGPEQRDYEPRQDLQSPYGERDESPHFWLLLLSALEPRFGSVGQGFVGRGRVQESLAG